MQRKSLSTELACSARGTVAASLLAEVAAAHESRLLAGISGAGGSGKSVLLDDLETQYRALGVPVRRGHADLDPYAFDTRAAVLVDDAHELNDSVLTRLHALVDEPDVNLVVAYRQWPQPAALGRLVAALEHHHPAVVLGPMTREDISAHAVAVLGSPVPIAFVERVAWLTGGMPWLVFRVLTAIPQDGRRAFSDPLISHDVIEQLGYELERVGGELRELLLVLTVGFDLSGRMPAALEQSAESIDGLVAQARADGLLLADGGLVPLVRQALLETTPSYQVHALQRALVDCLSADGRSLAEVARGLAQGGLKDSRVARALEQAGDGALATEPVLASTLYDEARAAGSDHLSTAARRAQAVSATGDLDGAGRIVDDLLAHELAPDLTRGVDVAAAVWAQRGMLSRSAEVYRWLEPARAGSSAALAAVAMIGTGDRDGAESMLNVAAPTGSPTLLSVGVTLMGQGIRESLEPCPTHALSTLIRASDMITASGVTTVPLPVVPAALAAMLALQTGELDVADSIIQAAVKGDQGGAAARPRLLLLQGWTAMQRDRPEQARAAIARATTAESRLAPRDQLLLHALEVGLARRTDDGPTLLRAWKQAREGILHVSVDLYSLVPLGELVVAGARVRDSSRLESPLAEAWKLLARLGDPPLWSVPLHWAAVQAAILSERPADLAPHAAALVHASEQNHLASVLSAAGRVWVSVLAGEVSVAAVEAAARGLASMGLTWDGSRLASHAAVRAAERKDMARLLACARDLHPGSPQPVGAVVEPSQSPSVAHITRTTTDETGLSAREREVAQLVLDGKTYREIGEAIFISPRTAEHHIARIRRRIGVTTRSELLAELRLLLSDDSAPAQ